MVARRETHAQATSCGRLAERLLAIAREQDFASTPDPARGGQPVDAPPSIDLALVRFAPGATPAWANVLLSREHPQGLAATIPPDAGAVQGIRFDADQRDAQLESPAWQPGADWTALVLGQRGHAFMNQGAADPANGMCFCPRAERRALAAMADFLDECLRSGAEVPMGACPAPA